MKNFFELVAAVCVANYLVAFAAIWGRSATERRRTRKMIAESLKRQQNLNKNQDGDR